MKRFFKYAIVPALLAAAVVLPASAQTVTIKFTHFLPSNSNFHKGVAEPWCADVERDSGGRIKCQLYPSLQLGGTPAQLADLVKNGVADVAWTSPSYTTGRFARSEALELPFTMPPDAIRGSRAMWEFVQRHAMEDYKDFKLLALFSGTNQIVHTAGRPVTGIDAFKGLRLRSPSRSVSLFMSALGAVPVNMPVAQITEGISKGVLDGAMVPWEVVPSVKIDEVTRFHLQVAEDQLGFVQSSLVILMNKRKYDSLPDELKEVIDKHSGDALVDRVARVFEDGNDQARKVVTAKGNTITTIGQADYDAIRQATAGIEAEWIKQVSARGIDGARLADEARRIGLKHLKN
jgi:TRAP-type C4-dicarboxylate transport system substrate-binding protein